MITIIGILGGFSGWLYNEWQKRIAKARSEKEERYKELITLVRSFGGAFYDRDKANKFILELQLCWMYCPDQVIQKGNNFLDLMKNKERPPDFQKNLDMAKGELILAIRSDLIAIGNPLSFLKKTILKPEDFRDVYFNDPDKDKEPKLLPGTTS